MRYTDMQENVITAMLLLSIGAVIAVFVKDHTFELMRQNHELISINTSLIKENKSLRYCVPKRDGKAVITIVNGRPFCEIHNKR